MCVHKCKMQVCERKCVCMNARCVSIVLFQQIQLLNRQLLIFFMM